MKKNKIYIALFLLFFTWSCTEKSNKLHIYTARHYDVDVELYKKFEAQYGIVVEITKANADELIYRLENEKELSTGDLLLTADAGKLGLAQQKGLFQDFSSAKIDENVPTHLRDAQWTAFTKRARVFAFMKDQVNENIKNYEDLALPELKGKLLIRSSDNSYNRDLMAALLAHWGVEKTQLWANEVVHNFAREPKGGDRDQMKAMALGEGTVVLTNSYYVGKLLHSSNPEEVKVGEQMKIIFPNQELQGTHINISGAGLLKHSKNKENAILFMEFLTSIPTQEFLTQVNYEFPVNPKAQMPETLRAWGSFKEDQLPLKNIIVHTPEALAVFDRAGWK